MVIKYYGRLVISLSGDGAVIVFGIKGYLFEIVIIYRNIMSVFTYRAGQPELCRDVVAGAAPCPTSGAGAEFVYNLAFVMEFQIYIVNTGVCKVARNAAVMPAEDLQLLVAVLSRYIDDSQIIFAVAVVRCGFDALQRRAAVKAMFCGIIERGTDGDGLQRRTTLKGAQHIRSVVGIADHVGADKIDLVADLDALEVGVALKGAAADDRDVLAPEEIIGIRNGDGIGHDDIRVLSVALCELVGVVAYFFKLKVRHSELIVADLLEVLISVGIDELSFASYIVLLEAVDIRLLLSRVIMRRFSIYAVGSEGLPRISVPFYAVGVVALGRKIDITVVLSAGVGIPITAEIMPVTIVPSVDNKLIGIGERKVTGTVPNSALSCAEVCFIKTAVGIHAAYDEICVKIGEAEIVTDHVYRFDPFAHKYLRALSRSRCHGDDGEYAEYHYQR